MRRPLKLWYYIALGVGRILLSGVVLLFDRSNEPARPQLRVVRPDDVVPRGDG